MRRLLILALTAIIPVIPTACARAAFGVGLRANYIDHSDLSDNTMTLGAMARLRTGIIGYELGLESRSFDTDEDTYKLKTRAVTASAMIHPVPVAYGLAGFGWYRGEIDGPAGSPSPSDNSIGFHYGIGFEWPMMPFLKLTGDVRRFSVDYEYPEGVGKVEAGGTEVSAGVLVSF